MSSKRVVITGGGGFVGSHLAQGYVRLGHAVTAIDLDFDAPTQARLAGATCVTGELGQVLRGLGGDWDMLIHAAAVTTSPTDLGEGEAGHLGLNLRLLLEAMAFAEHAAVKTFVFLSSSGVFTSDDAEDRLVETTQPSGKSAYALAKRSGELLMQSPFISGRRLVVRLGYVYGPDERVRPTRANISLVRFWLDLAQRGAEIRVVSPDVRRDWTFAPDLAKALEATLALAAAPDIIHLGSGEIVTDRDLAALIADVQSGTQVKIQDAVQQKAKAPMASLHLLPVGWTPLRTGLRATALASEAA